MHSRLAFAVVAAAATIQACLAAPKVVTVTLPVGDQGDDPVSIEQGGTGTDGRTTYFVAEATPTDSAALSTFTPTTVTLALGASDAIYEGSISGAGAITRSCGWGADSLATCVYIAPATLLASTGSGIATVTLDAETVGPTQFTVAEPSSTPSSSSSSSPSSSASGSVLPGSSGSSSAPAPSGTPSDASRTVVAWSGMLAATVLGMAWAL